MRVVYLLLMLIVVFSLSFIPFVHADVIDTQISCGDFECVTNVNDPAITYWWLLGGTTISSVAYIDDSNHHTGNFSLKLRCGGEPAVSYGVTEANASIFLLHPVTNGTVITFWLYSTHNYSVCFYFLPGLPACNIHEVFPSVLNQWVKYTYVNGVNFSTFVPTDNYYLVISEGGSWCPATWVDDIVLNPTPPTPAPSAVCHPCDTGLLNPHDLGQYGLIGMCLVVNAIVCSPILFLILIILILGLGTFFYLRARFQ
jgi:hypothetical protein